VIRQMNKMKEKTVRSTLDCIKCQSKTTDMMVADNLRLILTKLQGLTSDYNWLRESGGMWAGEKYSSITHMYWGQTHF